MSTPRSFPPAWRSAVVVVVLALAGAAFAYMPGSDETVTAAADGGGPVASAGSADDLAPGAPVVDGGGSNGSQAAAGGQSARSAVAGGAGRAAASNLQCAAGRNGGSTDVGVTGDSVKLGATVVDSGIGAAFLRDARYGMLAVKDRVNRAGGICGRKLELKLVDDGWEAGLGSQFIRNLVEDEKVFALAVVPSSEGLRVVSESGYLKAKGIPVVGTDGMLKHQYTDPTIWPVAASTITSMHVIVEYAAQQLAKKNFALVYETTYHFGIEGAYAFHEQVKRSIGSPVPGYEDPEGGRAGCQQRFCGIKAGQADYGSQIQEFNEACTQPPACDYIVLLLEPATALTWIKQGGLILPDGGTAGPQPLFTRSFAEECKSQCNGMWLWSGYLPAIDSNLGIPQVATYRDEIRTTSASADPTNTFVQGAYAGMQLLVEAMQRTGPALTRASLMATLDAMTYESGLTVSPHAWRPGNHFSNTSMKAYSIQYTDRFSGWRDQQVTWRDCCVGADLR